jgi:hypothetical protein
VLESQNPHLPAAAPAGLLSRKITGEVISKAATPPELESEMASSTFCDFFSLGAGVTPAEGSVKPTAGFTFNQVLVSQARRCLLNGVRYGSIACSGFIQNTTTGSFLADERYPTY